MKEKKLSHRQVMNRIYKDLCGYNIPREDTARVRESKGSPVYGEINHAALTKLLAHLSLTPKDIFYDLGSGVGKVILHAALFSPVKKAIGVELSQTRYQDALQALDNARAWSDNIHRRCEFKNADLLHVDLSSATVIYTCSTAFSLGFMKKISDRLREFDHDFRLVTLQDLPDDKHFSLETRLILDMSWIRKTPVFVYRRS